MLRVDKLRKSFGGVVATSDVSIDFPAGSLSAVIGPNGAGKTTFFNLISGGLQPDSGRILLDGVDIADIQLASLRAGLARRSRRVDGRVPSGLHAGMLRGSRGGRSVPTSSPSSRRDSSLV